MYLLSQTMLYACKDKNPYNQTNKQTKIRRSAASASLKLRRGELIHTVEFRRFQSISQSVSRLLLVLMRLVKSEREREKNTQP